MPNYYKFSNVTLIYIFIHAVSC